MFSFATRLNELEVNNAEKVGRNRGLNKDE
jgi:hypothetical protein